MFALYADLRFYALFWRFCFMLIAVLYSGASVPCWSIFSSKLIVVYSISSIFWFPCSVSFDAPVSCHVPVPYSYFISVLGHQFHVDAPVSCHIPVPCSCFVCVGAPAPCWYFGFMSCSVPCTCFRSVLVPKFLLMLHFHLAVVVLCRRNCATLGLLQGQNQQIRVSNGSGWGRKAGTFQHHDYRLLRQQVQVLTVLTNGQWLLFSPSNAVFFASCISVGGHFEHKLK